ncbi:tetratricopeptide repeat protein [Actinoplanes sp. NPDC049802]|uniref:tetratricopeptide repeat protein n=1 Tax=Actinoplanes sp. NPDC049802 TaxID=3154742 RepID=UPI00340B8474
MGSGQGGRWRPWRQARQTVTGSVVFGDVVQVADVGGDVTIVSRERPLYRVTAAEVAAVPLAPERARAQPSRLLAARHRIVPFTGRAAELGELAGWAGSAATVSARLLHGAGGQGKTRLAAEVAARCAAAGWTVWQVAHGVAPGEDRAGLTSGALLAVVDYADRWPMSALLTLLGQMRALHARTGARVRILMLARSAGYWWPSLAGRAENDHGIEAGAFVLDGPDAGRGDMFTAAAVRFGEVLGVAGDGWVAPDLSGPDFAPVLSVHMAALAAVDARLHRDEAPAGPRSIAEYLLAREQRHWRDMHEKAEDPIASPPMILHRATYTAALTGAVPRPVARRALIAAGLAADVTAADRVADDHRTCYPPADRRLVLEPPHPDRLGEDLIALSTPGHGLPTMLSYDDWPLSAPEALLGHEAEWTGAAVTTLIEAARRWPHLAGEVLCPLLRRDPELAILAGGNALTRLASIPGIDLDVLTAVESRLPAEPRADLDVAAAAISERLLRDRLRSGPGPATVAALHVDHAFRLARAGRWTEALTVGQTGVALLRRLAEEDPGAYLPALAVALNNTGTVLSELGRRREALALGEEAVAVGRGLAALDPDTHRPALAGNLADLAARLSALDRREECLAPAAEAVELLRALAVADPDRHQLALALNNFGAFLAEAGQRQRGLDLTEESAGLLWELADRDPDRYLPDLAMVVGNLGNRMLDTGRHAEALEPAIAAVGIHRSLAEMNPAVYRPRLASVLSNLAVKLAELGRWPEALPPSEESVALYRELVETNPDGYLPDLARVLSNHGLRLTELGRWPEALRPAEEAVARFRELGVDGARQENLGAALTNLSAVYTGLRRMAEALATTEEATALWRRMAVAHPEAHLPDVAISLRNRGVALANVGRRTEAVASAAEAVDLLRRLSEKEPAVHQPRLALAVGSLGRVLAETGRGREALPILAEAVTLHRRLAEGNPEVHRPELAGTLRHQGIQLSETGRPHEALACAEEAVDLHRRLAAAYPEKHLSGFGGALMHLMIVLCDLDRPAEARPVCREAIAVFRRVGRGDESALHGLGLASTMYAWICLETRRDLMGARAAAAESIRIHTPLAERDPGAFADRLAQAYVTYAGVLEASGSPDQAEEIRRRMLSGQP